MHYSGTNIYLFVNGTENYIFKAKDFEIVTTPLCLGNISKDWSTNNMKKQGLKHTSMILVLDYDATDADDIADIHKYLIKRNNIV